MMLMVKDGYEYSLIGGYVDNTIKQLLANKTQVRSETETEVTKFDVIEETITKEFSSKTGMSNFPLSIASKYLLDTPTIYNISEQFKTFNQELHAEQEKLKRIEREINEKN